MRTFILISAAVLMLIPNAIAGTLANVVVTEIMQNPAFVGDAEGEYFEVFNNSAVPIDMIGWTIKDNDTDTFTVSSSVVVPGFGYAVFCVNQSSAVNGGFTCDYQYSSMAIANGADEIVLLDGAMNEVDRVEYDGGTTFPDPTGASMVFVGVPGTDDNNLGSNWQTATVREGSFDMTGTDLGSPGAQGSDQQLPVRLKTFKVD